MQKSIDFIIPNIQSFFIESGMSDTEIARGLDMKYSSFVQLKERLALGTIPRLQTLQRIANFAGVSIAQFFVAPGTELGAEYKDACIDYIGSNITHVRAFKNMTSRSVLRETGITRSCLYRYEHGEHIPGAVNLQKVADALGVDPIALLVPQAEAVSCVEYCKDTLAEKAPHEGAHLLENLEDPKKDISFGELESLGRKIETPIRDFFLWHEAGPVFKSKYVNADPSNIQANLLRYRVRRGLSKDTLYPLRDWENHSAPPPVKETQRLANVLHVGILDLLVTVHQPRNPTGKKKKAPRDLGPLIPEKDKITGIKYGQERIKAIIKRYSIRGTAHKADLAEVTVRRLLRSGDAEYRVTTIGVLNSIAALGGYSIAELFVKPGVDTGWYKDASVIFFADNLRQLREDAGLTTKGMAKHIGCHTSSYWTYETGQVLPKLERVQHIADCMRVEVGDLFIPPDDILF